MEKIRNKKALFNYEVIERLEAGIELFGHEVKSIKTGRLNFEGSYVSVRGGEVFLVGASIAAFQPKNTPEDYEPLRPRRLLLSKKEILQLLGVEKQAGLTVVPTSMYNKGKKIKCEIAIVRGKKQFDKRESLKKKADERDMRRTLKNS